MQSNNKLFTEKMLEIINEMEKLVDLKPVNLIQIRLNLKYIILIFLDLKIKKIE